MKGSGSYNATFTKTLNSSDIALLCGFTLLLVYSKQLCFNAPALAIARGAYLSPLTRSLHKQGSTCYTISSFSSARFP